MVFGCVGVVKYKMAANMGEYVNYYFVVTGTDTDSVQD